MLNINFNLNKGNGRYDSLMGMDGKIKPKDIATYRFDQGDTTALVKNGFSWASTSSTINAPSGFVETGVNYSYIGNIDPTADSTSERRFAFTSMGELCIKMRFHVPANYFHRSLLGVNITGDITAWAVNDVIRAADGTSTGTLYYKNGQTIYLLFAMNDLVGAGVWTGNITNITRASTLAGVRAGNEASNNKLLALWCDGYSAAGGSPSIAWEMHADRSGGSTVYYHFGANNAVVGTLPNSTSSDATFIRPSDVNKWFDVLFYLKMGSNEDSADGIIRTWLRREGESNYALLLEQTNAMIAPRVSGSNAKFKNGYCHGWANSGFAETTVLRDSIFSLNTRSIDGVNL